MADQHHTDDLRPAPTDSTPAVNEQKTLRERLPVYALVAAATISTAGNYLTSIALPWFVYATTGSASRTGMVAFAGLLPVLIAGIIGGAVVDRLGSRRSSMISDFASGVTVAIVPTLHLLGLLAFWHILVVAFIGALLDIPAMSARQSLVPRLAARAGIALERVNAALQLTGSLSAVIGPVLAGVLVGAIGATGVLYVNAGTFAIAILLIALGIRAADDVRVQTSADGSGLQALVRGTLSDAREGLRMLFGQPLLRTIIIVAVFANAVFAPLFAVIMPVMARELFGRPSALGGMVAAFGAGSVAGTVLHGVLGPRLPRRAFFNACIVILAVGLWGIVPQPPFVLILAALFTLGVATGPTNVIVITVLQERTPEGMHGRTFGAFIALAQLAAPLSVLLVGVAVDRFGTTTTLVVLAAVLSCVMLGALIHPVTRDITAHTSTPAPSVDPATTTTRNGATA